MKTILTLALSLFSFITFAQGFQGMAVYESKTGMGDMKARLEGNKKITPDMQKMIEANMKKMFEKRFIMHFDQAASIYKEEEKLETPGGGGGMRFSMGGANGSLYKNVKERQYTRDKEMFGKEFLIVDSLQTYNWKMTGESRKIGNYTCFKATATKKVDKTDFKNFRMRKPKEEKAEKAKDSIESTKKTNFMENMEIPEEIEVVAWYAPEIPINQGPGEYWGLPGLILEVNEGKTTILCSKLVMNTSDRKKIEPATKGKKVSQAEYEDIVVKKMEEMRKMYGGKGRGRGGVRFIKQ